MSLPSTNPPRAQLSIRSFFQPHQPSCASPPSQIKPGAENTRPNTQPAPPAPVQLARPVELARPVVPAPIVETPAPASKNPTSIPSQAIIRAITDKDIAALRRINALLLPVNYPDTFYQNLLDPAASGPFSRVILWADSVSNPKVVGGVVCHVELSPFAASADTTNPEHALYIESLCLLSPYRSFGIATVALDEIIAAAVSNPRLNVRTVYAHVWTENEDGLRWYEARGFAKDGLPISGYYLRLRPASAWIVRRNVVLPTIRNELPLPSSMAAEPTEPVKLSTTATVANLPLATGPAVTPPARAESAQSFQKMGPGMEWNDLPADMAPNLLMPPRSNGGSSASSRSSSMAPQKKKKERAYPAAAFGS